MQTWQLVIGTLFLLIPLALLLDFWPHRERLSSSGQPLPRTWRPSVAQPPEDDHH